MHLVINTTQSPNVNVFCYNYLLFRLTWCTVIISPTAGVSTVVAVVTTTVCIVLGLIIVGVALVLFQRWYVLCTMYMCETCKSIK